MIIRDGEVRREILRRQSSQAPWLRPRLGTASLCQRVPKTSISRATRVTVLPSSNTSRTTPALHSSVKCRRALLYSLAWLDDRHRIRLSWGVHESRIKSISPFRFDFGDRGARNHLQANMVLEFRDEITLSAQGAARRSSSPTARGVPALLNPPVTERWSYVT